MDKIERNIKILDFCFIILNSLLLIFIGRLVFIVHLRFVEWGIPLSFKKDPHALGGTSFLQVSPFWPVKECCFLSACCCCVILFNQRI